MKRAVVRVVLVLAAVVAILWLGKGLQKPEDPTYLKAAVAEADGLIVRRRAGDRTVEASVRDRETLAELAMLMEFDRGSVRMRPSGEPATTPVIDVEIRRGGKAVETLTVVGAVTLWYGPDREFQVFLADKAFGEAIAKRVDWP